MMDGVGKGGIEPADTVAMRHAMVASQLRTTGDDDERIVTAMANLPREPFVPAASRNLAYRDTAIPLGGGRYLNTPMATARLLTEAEILPDDRVLLIGAATGYAAAVLVRLGARVTAVEEVPALAATARDTLAGLDVVEVVEGPLPEGHAAGAPYDVLFVDGAVEQLPDTLLAQLRPTGRIATGLIDNGVLRLATGRRTSKGAGLVPFADAECVPLPGFAPPPVFRF
jgi:protein-L-isoaspartate(D-aspartate) O-methyltransferase